MRVQATGENDLVAPGEASRHQHRFGRTGGAVIERGIGHVHAGDPGDLGLELEEHLQGALRNLGLVGRIGREPFRALDEMIDRGRHMVAIGPGADEERTVARSMVLSGQRAHMSFDQKFRTVVRQVEAEALIGGFGHGAEQRIDIGGADDAKHFGALGLGMGEIAHDYFVRSA